MTCSDVKLACCRLCGKPIASDLGECIHCGVCKPVPKEECSWLHRVLFILLLLGVILAAMRYEPHGDTDWDCATERIRDERC